MNSGKRNSKSRKQSASKKSSHPSWGIVVMSSILFLVLGLLIGAFVLNSSAVPDPNHQATADPPVIEPEVEVEETVSPTPASTTPATVAETQPVPEPTAEEELKSSIQNAIDTIEKKSAQIFVYSYLPFEMRQRYEQVVEREGRSVVDQALSKKVFKEYRIHLQSALNGSV